MEEACFKIVFRGESLLTELTEPVSVSITCEDGASVRAQCRSGEENNSFDVSYTPLKPGETFFFHFSKNARHPCVCLGLHSIQISVGPEEIPGSTFVVFLLLSSFLTFLDAYNIYCRFLQALNECVGKFESTTLRLLFHQRCFQVLTLFS